MADVVRFVIMLCYSCQQIRSLGAPLHLPHNIPELAGINHINNLDNNCHLFQYKAVSNIHTFLYLDYGNFPSYLVAQ